MPDTTHENLTGYLDEVRGRDSKGFWGKAESICKLKEHQKVLDGRLSSKFNEYFADRRIGRRHFGRFRATALKQRRERMREGWYVFIHCIFRFIDFLAPARWSGFAETLQNLKQATVNVGSKKIGSNPVGFPARLNMRVIENGEIKRLPNKPHRPVEKRMLVVLLRA